MARVSSEPAVQQNAPQTLAARIEPRCRLARFGAVLFHISRPLRSPKINVQDMRSEGSHRRTPAQASPKSPNLQTGFLPKTTTLFPSLLQEPEAQSGLWGGLVRVCGLCGVGEACACHLRPYAGGLLGQPVPLFPRFADFHSARDWVKLLQHVFANRFCAETGCGQGLGLLNASCVFRTFVITQRPINKQTELRGHIVYCVACSSLSQSAYTGPGGNIAILA